MSFKTENKMTRFLYTSIGVYLILIGWSGKADKIMGERIAQMPFGMFSFLTCQGWAITSLFLFCKFLMGLDNFMAGYLFTLAFILETTIFLLFTTVGYFNVYAMLSSEDLAKAEFIHYIQTCSTHFLPIILLVIVYFNHRYLFVVSKRMGWIIFMHMNVYIAMIMYTNLCKNMYAYRFMMNYTFKKNMFIGIWNAFAQFFNFRNLLLFAYKVHK